MKRITALIFFLVFILSSTIGALIYFNLKTLKNKIYEEKKKEIKNVVDTAYSAITYYQSLPLPESIKKKKIINLIKHLRFEKFNYFWLFTNTNPPVMIMHPYFPELNGKELIKMKYNCATMIEYNGTKEKLNNENLFVAMVKILQKANEGYVLYKWPKPTDNGTTKKAYEKLSFIKKIPKYNWVIGAGIYIDDIQEEYNKSLQKYINFLTPLLIIVIIITLLIVKTILNLHHELEMNQRKITKLAFKDQLTGLLNRVSFDEEFEKILKSHKMLNKEFAVLFLDLDRFKEVNDNFGHEEGDKLLIEIANRLKKLLRKDDIIARLGGDEFVIILPNTKLEEAKDIAKKIINSLQISIKDIKIGVSIGIAMFPKDATTKKELLKVADTLMYKAKEKRNQIISKEEL